MNISLKDLAKKIGAQVADGQDDVVVRGVSALATANEGDITFLSSLKYLDQAKTTQASAIILPKDIPDVKAAKLLTDNPYLCWAKTAEIFVPDRSEHLPHGSDPTAVIHPSADIAADAHVGPNATVGAGTRLGAGCIVHSGVVIEENCTIGRNVEIHPNVVIHYGTRIGDRCVIWSNAVIGSYGFGNAKDGAKFVRIHQLGNTVLEDDVHIGSGTTVDRGAVDDTVIKRGAIIDNLVMIAHNVIIGEDTAIAAQTGISGSTRIGDRVLIAGQAGFVGHIEIGHDSFVGGQAGISKSFPPGSKITGYPARNLMDVRRSDTAVSNLPELVKRVKALEKKIKELESN